MEPDCSTIVEAMLAEPCESVHLCGLIDWLQEHDRSPEAFALGRWGAAQELGRRKYVELNEPRHDATFKWAPALVLLGLAYYVATWQGALTAARRRRIARMFATGTQGNASLKRWTGTKQNRTTRARFLHIRNIAIVNGRGTLGSDLYYSIGDAATGYGMDTTLTDAAEAVWYPHGTDPRTHDAVERGVSDWFDGWMWLCSEAAIAMKPRKKRSR